MADLAQPEGTPQVDEIFEGKKRKYFSQLALRNLSAFRMHAKAGLWPDGDKWRTGRHELAVAARCEAIGELLRLSPDACKRLTYSGTVHDFYKTREMQISAEARGAGKSQWEAFAEAEDKAKEKLTEARVDPLIIEIADAAGHNGVNDMDAILKERDLSDQQIARLALHYIDSISNQDQWSAPAEIRDVTRQKINALDRRMDGLESADRYRALNEEGRQHFNGATAYQAMRRTGHAIEERFAELIMERTGTPIDPLELPTIIDARIREKIMEIPE